MKSVWAFILLTLLSLGAAADRILVMPAMEPYYSENGNARYQQLIKEILQRSGSNISIEYLPPAKSIQFRTRVQGAFWLPAFTAANTLHGIDADTFLATRQLNLAASLKPPASFYRLP